MQINHMGQPFQLEVSQSKRNRKLTTVVVHHIGQVKVDVKTTERKRVVEEHQVFETDGKGQIVHDDQGQPVPFKNEEGQFVFTKTSKMEDVTVIVEAFEGKPKKIGDFVIYSRVPTTWIKRMAKIWIEENAPEKIFETDEEKN